MKRYGFYSIVFCLFVGPIISGRFPHAVWRGVFSRGRVPPDKNHETSR